MWYESKDTNFEEIDTDKITKNGALTAKALSDVFLGIAKVVDDREKINMLAEKNKLDNEKQQIDLSKSYQDIEQKAIDDTYLNYVDSNTGKFNQEQFDKDNVGLPMNQVSLNARNIQQNLKDAYTIRTDKEEQKNKSNYADEVAGVMLNSPTKADFMKNVNPETLKNADKKTLLEIESFYDKKANELKAIQNAKNNLANETQLSKLQIELAKEKAKGDTNAPREVKAADESLISKNVGAYFGGTYNPATGEITGLDKETAKTVSQVQAEASKYYKENRNLTHNEATLLALKDYEKSISPTPTDEPKPTVDNDPFGWLNKK